MPDPKKPEENPEIPLDIASYKLYYVNYEIELSHCHCGPSVQDQHLHSPPVL